MKHFEVVCAIIKKDNLYFICQRNEKGECAFKWEFPGGKINEGETKETALKREIKEELNSEIKIIKYITTINHTYNTFKITMHAYLCELVKGDLDLSEHLDKKFISFNDFDKFDFSFADVLVINEMKKMNL